MMRFTKIYWGVKGNFGASIRTSTYTRSLAHIQKMVDEVKKDYPNLTLSSEDITLVIYSGERCKGMMGLEFCVPTPAEGYLEKDPPTIY